MKKQARSTLKPDNLQEFVEILRQKGVSKFEGFGVSIELSERAYLKQPIQDNTTDEEPEKNSKQEENEEEDLFYSSPLGGRRENRTQSS